MKATRIKLRSRQDKDFTLFAKLRSKDPVAKAFHALCDESLGNTSHTERARGNFSVDAAVELEGRLEGKPYFLRARALFCCCYEQDHISVTMRIVDDIPKGFKPTSPKVVIPAELKRESFKSNYFKPPAHAWQKQLLTLLYERIWPIDDPSGELRGLIYITGATKSGKNFLANTLIHHYLTDNRFLECWSKTRGRRPHLVTLEDPIERYFMIDPSSLTQTSPDAVQKLGIDYTPRQKGTDALTLRRVIDDALRQTPSILFVGETRDKTELRELVDFAGTGHLVITTGHAHSLREAVGKLIDACDARTPVARKELANKLCATVHLLPHSATGDLLLRIPAVFRSNSPGERALMAEGRGCLLPYSHAPTNHDAFCWGRSWFVNQLSSGGGPPKVRGDLKAWALASDLAGL